MRVLLANVYVPNNSVGIHVESDNNDAAHDGKAINYAAQAENLGRLHNFDVTNQFYNLQQTQILRHLMCFCVEIC